ncbi:MAG: glycosyltransferase family 39 protein [Actinomycetota bacterium]
MSRRTAYGLVAVVCAVPRLGILLHERDAITASFTEKSDTIARMFVEHGTFGFVPGAPSAYTQPLYAWFLIPIYWIFGANWWSIGTAQILVAIATALLVFELGSRVLCRRAGLIAAAIATLNPYLVWHDVHVNREIVDQLVAAALVLLTLLVVERPARWRALLLGVVSGISMLGNTRLVFIPILCAVYVAWRLPRARATALVAALVLAGAAVAVAPWLVRNQVSVGCFTLTTDGRAMWKANNPRTYHLLSSGEWIDNIGRHPPRPPAPGRLTPEDANGIWLRNGRALHPDECLEMRFYQHLAVEWMHKHPGQKTKLAALSAKILWQPSVFETTDRSGAGTQLDLGRRLLEPAYMWALYALAVVGLFLAPRAFVALALLLLAYQTAAALVFVGATRYRVAWDFLLAILAAATIEHLIQRLRPR